eukprot:TRINITY_DN19709_c0_g1_i5.p1 TRINITY_DN19709_c0_g1~~TRINITY_DN19709_c0_g1_i5.p1  ORF type:complete len:139 (-),score=49.13 TRINITY_DN19709_c0_g1_i5:109-495(-)
MGDDMQAQRNHIQRRVVSLAKELDKRIKDSSQHQAQELATLRAENDRLQEEVRRKTRSLDCAMEALADLNNNRQKLEMAKATAAKREPTKSANPAAAPRRATSQTSTTSQPHSQSPRGSISDEHAELP